MANNIKKGSQNPKTKEVEEDKAKPKRFHYESWLTTPVETPPTAVQITTSHQDLIRTTWNYINGYMSEHGTRVFVRIFQVSSGIQGVFRLDGVDSTDLPNTAILQRHATQFLEAIEFAVKNMANLRDLVAPVFVNLGKSHIRFRGIKDEHFGVFSGALMYVWKETLGDKFTPETRVAWSRLVDYLIQHLQFGYHIALEQAKTV